MKISKENGFTGIDIAISVVVIFIFVSLIAFLIYSFNSSSKELEYKSEAINIAIQEIEQLKNTIDVDSIRTKGIENVDEYESSQKVKEGYFKKVLIEDYKHIHPDKESDIVKKVTVEVQYQFKKEPQTVALSTIITMNN